jgi:hypothetical protein
MNNTEKESSEKIKPGFIFSAIMLLVFLLYYIIMSALGPSKKLNEIKDSFRVSDDSESKIDERYYADSAYLSLLKEKSFLQSRIAMAQTDSIYIAFNLADSTANLEISGVTVHTAKMSQVKTSRILGDGNGYEIYAMLAAPMTINRDFSTILKEPLMIKMAPKDTSEFKPDIIPDTTDFEPVNYILEMDNGVRIYVYQETDTIRSDKRRLFFFDLADRMRNVWSSLKSIALLRIPEYHPFIKVRLPKADAKIIYRAVPRNGQVAVYR